MKVAFNEGAAMKPRNALMALPMLAVALFAAPASAEAVFPRTMIEYPLPGAQHTHELIAIGDTILVTQMDTSTLVKAQRDRTTGLLTSANSFPVLDEAGKPGGLHGIVASTKFPGKVWLTLQYSDEILLVDPKVASATTAPEVLLRIKVPIVAQSTEFPYARAVHGKMGPHGITEVGDWVWSTLKDASYVLKLKIPAAADRRVVTPAAADYALFKVSDEPVFVAKHQHNKFVYVSQDVGSHVRRIDSDAMSDSSSVNIDMRFPEEVGTTAVGMIQGPDGNVWFALAGKGGPGTGTFGKIKADHQIDWFTLPSPTDHPDRYPAKSNLLHLAFETGASPPRLWLLSSSITHENGLNGLIQVTMDPAYSVVTHQEATVLSTQHSWAHRVLVFPGDSVFISQLLVSSLVQVPMAPASLQREISPEQFRRIGYGSRETSVTYPASLTGR